MYRLQELQSLAEHLSVCQLLLSGLVLTVTSLGAPPASASDFIGIVLIRMLPCALRGLIYHDFANLFGVYWYRHGFFS